MRINASITSIVFTAPGPAHAGMLAAGLALIAGALRRASMHDSMVAAALVPTGGGGRSARARAGSERADDLLRYVA